MLIISLILYLSFPSIEVNAYPFGEQKAMRPKFCKTEGVSCIDRSIGFLENSDPAKAEQAFAFIAALSFDELKANIDKFSLASLRRWLIDQNIPLHRRDLYGFVLGLHHKHPDRQLLSRAIDQTVTNPKYRNESIAGMLLGYALSGTRYALPIFMKIARMRTSTVHSIDAIKATEFLITLDKNQYTLWLSRVLALGLGNQMDVKLAAVEVATNTSETSLAADISSLYEKSEIPEPLRDAVVDYCSRNRISGCLKISPKEEDVTPPMTEITTTTTQLPLLCTQFSICLFTTNLLPDDGEIQLVSLTDSDHGCLHDYHIKPGDIEKVQSAARIVINGDEIYETALKPLFKDVDEEVWIVSLSRKDNDHDHSDEHDIHKLAHAFSDPFVAREQINNIADGLIDWQPKLKRSINKNRKSYLRNLDKLIVEFKKKRKNFEGVKVMIVRDSIEPLVRVLGMEVVPVFKDSEIERPSPKELMKASKVIRDNGVQLILYDKSYPSRYAQTVAEETSVPLVPLDSLTSGPADLSREDYYSDVMKGNIGVLLAALASKEE